jgi:phage portal protein BeeE
VFEKRTDGQRDATNGHPIKALISDPNPRETSIEFLENLIDDLASAGRFLAERDWTSGAERLWRIEPKDFTVELLSDNSLRFRVREDGRPERVLLHDEVWYIPLPPVIGKVHGRSPILKDGAETIGAALALQRYANTFFANDATPPFIFKHKGNFADAASKENFLSGSRG